MIIIKEFTTDTGRSPFQEWFDRLDAQAAAKITTMLYRLSLGNTSQVKSLGSGVFEIKIDFGPGYRIYFSYEDVTIVILLGGGTKQGQQRDVKQAKKRWEDYKKCKLH